MGYFETLHADVMDNMNGALVADTKTVIKTIFDEIFRKENYRVAFSGISNGMTFEATGKLLGVKKTRITPIKNTVIRRFNEGCEIFYDGETNVVRELFLDMGEEYALTADEIIDFLPEYGKEFVYVMKEIASDISGYAYDADKNAFITTDDSVLIDAYDMISDFCPLYFTADEMDDLIDDLSSRLILSKRIVRIFLEGNYHKKGKFYCKSQITKFLIGKIIVKEHFAEGFRVGKAEDIARFRQIALDVYGFDFSNVDDHAVVGTATYGNLLRDRGTYVFYDAKVAPAELLSEIHDYINEICVSRVFVRDIYDAFADRLNAAGVDNHYYLHGLLEKSYRDEWKFSRDYISKKDYVDKIA